MKFLPDVAEEIQIQIIKINKMWLLVKYSLLVVV